MPWKVLEGQGFIATAICTEGAASLDPTHKASYQSAGARAKFRVAWEADDARWSSASWTSTRARTS